MRLRQRERQRSADLGADLLQTAIFRSNLTTSLVPSVGAGDPTWSRATKAWGFNELGYLEEIASGCAFFGGARLVRNTVRTKSEDFSIAGWPRTGVTVSGTNTIVCDNSTSVQYIAQSSSGTAVVTGEHFLYGIRAEYIPGGVDFIQIKSGNSGFGIDFLNVSLIDGTYRSSGGVYASVVNVSPGVYDINLRAVADATVNGDYFAIYLIDNLDELGGGSFVGDGIKSFNILRAWGYNVTNYPLNYIPEYVSVGVTASPYFGAGIDGAKYFGTDQNGLALGRDKLIGFRREAAATNNLLHSRDLGNAAWSTKTNITAAKTATGLDGIANTATTLTATAADAIILQPITLASAARCASAYVKRRTGTGTVSFTQDGGSTWTDITAQINGSTWSRVEITATLADPSTGFKISTSGDAIDVDCVQNEAGAVATSPIVTTTTTVTRNAESLTYQTASNIDFAVGSAYFELITSGSGTTRHGIQVGTSYAGIHNSNPNTAFRIYDGTTVTTKVSLDDATAGIVKRAISWGVDGEKVTGAGATPQTDAFDGDFGDGATINIGVALNGYMRNVAILNYQMTAAELQEITK